MSENKSWIHILTIIFPKSFYRKISDIRNYSKSVYEARQLTPEEKNAWNTKVLIGSMRNADQFEANLIHRFYHIPKVLIEDKCFPISYIALYQSNRLFGKRSGIHYFGKVCNCSLVKRNEILEIPSQRENLYYRFDVEKWDKLEQKISIKEQGSTFLISNLYLLTHATEYPQLKVKNALDFYLYQYLLDENRSKTIFPYISGNIQVKDGIIVLTSKRNGKLTIAYDEFTQRPSVCISKIHKHFLD